MPHASRTILVEPLSRGELRAMRREEADRSFDATLERAGRLGFLAADGWGLLDPEDSAALRRAETSAVLELAAIPTRNDEQRLAKARVVRAWREGGEVAPLVGAMLAAALEADRPKAAPYWVLAGRRERERS